MSEAVTFVAERALESTSESPDLPENPRPPIMNTRLHLLKEATSFSPSIRGVVEAVIILSSRFKFSSCFLSAFSQ